MSEHKPAPKPQLNSACLLYTSMDRFGTGPVRSAYFMLSSTELQTDFDGLTGAGFINQWNYPTNASALPSEYGSVFNIRILTSSEAPVGRGVSSNGRDVYYNTVVAKQAITHINQDGYSIEFVELKPLVIDLELLAA